MAVVGARKRPMLRWISLVCVLIAMPVTYAVTQWSRQAILVDMHDQAQDALKVQLAYLQSRIQGLLTMTRIVGADERVIAILQHPEDSIRRENANHYLSSFYVTTGSNAFVMNTRGKVLASGNWDEEDSFVGWDLSARTYFQFAAVGETAIYVAVGVISRRLGFYVAVPIYHEGELIGVAVTKTDPQILVLPEERADHPFIVADSSGVVIISRPQRHLLRSITKPGPMALMRRDTPERFPDMEIEPITTVPIHYHKGVPLISLPPAAPSDPTATTTRYVLADAAMPEFRWKAHILWPIKDLNAILRLRVLLTLLAMAVTWLITIFVIERWRNMKHMQQQAFRDPLTRLYTRLYMLESATALLAAHDRCSIPGVSAIMFDLDHFKAINDRYGHSAGDGVLVKVADVLIRECRESDIPIRYGGEEFLIFVPNQDGRQVAQLAERIRLEIKKLKIDLAGNLVCLTISGGVATHLRGEPLEKLIDRADQRMYEAKQKGRDRVVSEPATADAEAETIK